MHHVVTRCHAPLLSTTHRAGTPATCALLAQTLKLSRRWRSIKQIQPSISTTPEEWARIRDRNLELGFTDEGIPATPMIRRVDTPLRGEQQQGMRQIQYTPLEKQKLQTRFPVIRSLGLERQLEPSKHREWSKVRFTPALPRAIRGEGEHQQPIGFARNAPAEAPEWYQGAVRREVPTDTALRETMPSWRQKMIGRPAMQRMQEQRLRPLTPRQIERAEYRDKLRPESNRLRAEVKRLWEIRKGETLDDRFPKYMIPSVDDHKCLNALVELAKLTPGPMGLMQARRLLQEVRLEDEQRTTNVAKNLKQRTVQKAIYLFKKVFLAYTLLELADKAAHKGAGSKDVGVGQNIRAKGGSGNMAQILTGG